MDRKNKVLVITGPTAVGKSEIAIDFAKIFNGEIISADSMQIYRDLDIGTAKINQDEMQGIKHHLINVRDFNQTYNAWQFVNDAKKLIIDINARGKMAIICGGTALYIKALTENFDFKDINHINKNPQKQQENDEQISNFYNNFEFVIFTLQIDRANLYSKIDLRVDKMVEKGIFNEVKNLIKKGLKLDFQAGKSIGYREIIQHFNGELSYDETIEKFKQHSRNYAKRQITFIKTIKNVIWIDAEDKKRAFKEIFERFNNA